MGYIRDLKGIKNKQNKTIKEHFLIRSASLDKPSKKQIKYLNNIGVKRIFDLRNEAEAIHDPDIQINNSTYYNYSLIDSDLNGITHQNRAKQLISIREMPTMEKCYIGMVSDDYSLSAIKKVIRKIVLEDGFPTIVHCVTGKDRAGIVTMLLLSILDVDYEVIVEDYLKQRKLYIGKACWLFFITFILTFDKNLAIKVYEYYAIERKYIDVTTKTINDNYGSVESFIKDYIGLTDQDINAFKEKALL